MSAAIACVMEKLGGFANLPTDWLATQTGSSARTVRRWKRSGRAPRLVVRFLLLLFERELGELAGEWKGWNLRGGTLNSPDGHAFTANEVRAIPYRAMQIRALERERELAATTPTTSPLASLHEPPTREPVALLNAPACGAPLSSAGASFSSSSSSHVSPPSLPAAAAKNPARHALASAVHAAFSDRPS